ncbi:MAG TPA: acyl-CoA dehydrogenase family protein, partial [Steroidobacteraceae bacterium]|nr:acyl-CoA dehydrogenase family protein [Steroidobacteraceae bacterium]
MATAAASTPAAGKPAGTACDPLDLFGVRAALSDEERLVQESVARLVDAEVLPVIQSCFEEHRFPQDLVPKLAS